MGLFDMMTRRHTVRHTAPMVRCICCTTMVPVGATSCPNCLVSLLTTGYLKEVNNMTNTGVVEIECIMCHTKHTVLVPTAGYKQWASGQAKIQDALPSLSADERELLMSNICPKCWDKTFGE